MIIFCHGMAKSASSFVTQLTLGLVRIHCQKNYFKLRSLKDYLPGSNGLFVDDHIDLDSLVREIYDDIGTSREHFIVIKIHRACTPYVASMIESCRVKAISTYRDPRDIALSLLDAARLDFANNKNRFTKYKSIVDTQEMVDYQIKCFKTWSAVKNISLVSYEDIALNPNNVSHQISSYLGFEDNESVVVDLTSDKSTIWEYNKGVLNRWVSEFEPSDVSAWQSRVDEFSSYIESLRT